MSKSRFATGAAMLIASLIYSLASFHGAWAAAAPTFSSTLYNGSAGIALGDFNGDGKLDLAGISWADTELRVRYGNGDGTFGPVNLYETPSAGAYRMLVIDVNRDGRDDVIIPYFNGAQGYFAVMLNNGNGFTSMPLDYVGGWQWNIVAGDFDRDGNPDLAIAIGTALAVKLGKGDGTFKPGNYYLRDTDGYGPEAVSVGDFNGDGKPDLAVASWDSTGYRIVTLKGNDDGTFDTVSIPMSPAGGIQPTHIVTGDFNRDGILDLAVANRGDSGGGSNVSVLLGNGQGGFSLSYSSPPNGAQEVRVGDFNGDGVDDVVTAVYNNIDNAWVLIGNGDGINFTQLALNGGFYNANWVAVGDFNRDGKTDFSVCYTDCLVYLNTAPSVPSTFPINIDPQLYTGRYMVGGPNGSLGFFNGPKTLNLAPGDYYAGLGVGIVPAAASNGAQYFLFTVNGSGQVENLQNAVTHGPSGAAIANGNTITLNNGVITVDPQAYTGRYVFDAYYFPHSTHFFGQRNIVLIPELVQVAGLAFEAYSPAGAEGSKFFLLALNSSGQIATVLNGITLGPSGAAFGNGSTLTLNNVTITVEPNAYAGRYTLDSHYYPNLVTFQGRQSIVIVPELLNAFDNTGGFNSLTVNGVQAATTFSFAVNSGGVITSLIDLTHFLNHTTGAFMATTSGSVLSLNTVNVRVDPTTYAQAYRIAGYLTNTGITTLALIPGLGTALAANNVGGVFIPDVSAVNPSSLVLNIEGQPYTFLFTPVAARPVANAGSNQSTEEGTVVTLNGTASSGENLSFQWTQIAGPAATILNSTTPTPSIATPILAGGLGSQVLTFKLTVTSGGQSDFATVNVTVVNVNHAPEAQPGGDQNVDEGALVRLDGHFSFDPDGDPISYQWVQTAGTPVTLGADPTDLTNPAKAAFIAPAIAGGIAGPVTLTFKLIVSDTQFASEGSVNVVVENINHAPTANAGNPQTVHPGTTVYLVGSGDDPDWDQVSFQWTQVSGPTVSLSNAGTATAYFAAPPVSGTTDLKFRLTVSDGVLGTSSDAVITVKNGAPVCHAARAVPDLLWPPNHGLVSVGISGVTDPDDGSVAINITGVTQDEAVNGLGDGDTSPDAVIQGNKTLLRSERSGNGNGRVYRVNFTANDGNGGTCAGSVNVNVPRDMKPGSSAIDSGQVYNATQP